MAFSSKDFQDWIRQPTTISGLGLLAGTACSSIAGIIVHYSAHDPETTAYTIAAVAGLVASAVKMILPDNSAAPSSVEKFMTDAITSATQKHLADSLPALVSEGMATLQVLQAPLGAPTPLPGAPWRSYTAPTPLPDAPTPLPGAPAQPPGAPTPPSPIPVLTAGSTGASPLPSPGLKPIT